MVAVTKRFESGPIKSRVGAFPDVFSMTNGRFKGTENRSEPRVRFRLAVVNSGYELCRYKRAFSLQRGVNSKGPFIYIYIYSDTTQLNSTSS